MEAQAVVRSQTLVNADNPNTEIAQTLYFGDDGMVMREISFQSTTVVIPILAHTMDVVQVNLLSSE